jgi:integrase/recombinase XerC
LDLTEGNVRAVRDLSRHARLETLQRYDDNRKDFQGAVSDKLSDLFGDR